MNTLGINVIIVGNTHKISKLCFIASFCDPFLTRVEPKPFPGTNSFAQMINDTQVRNVIKFAE